MSQGQSRSNLKAWGSEEIVARAGRSAVAANWLLAGKPLASDLDGLRAGTSSWVEKEP